ncbi:hypothetical protein E2C01_018353 [Portunus trituberculatus]|uniref:Uncharacterized protein n=1 Tax=Portunus trituberculatus TaxID=210409 RepID=A0A5B7DUX5_PORTR|nr:hypothetical protein [Portunus trituberculatus]
MSRGRSGVGVAYPLPAHTSIPSVAGNREEGAFPPPPRPTSGAGRGRPPPRRLPSINSKLNNHIAFVFAVVCDVLARAAARDTV